MTSVASTPVTQGSAALTKFVILTSGRSGSSWLMEMLNSHPTVGGYGELFSSRFATRYPQTRAAEFGDPGGIPFFGAHLGDLRAVNPLTAPYLGIRYLNRVYAPRAGLEAIGFRARYGNLRVRWGGMPVGVWLLPYMAAARVSVVHLVRRNGLDFVISRAAATASGVRHAAAADRLEAAKVRLDPTNLVKQLEAHERHERLMTRTLASFRLAVHRVAYEDVRADTRREYRRLIDFLGAPADHEPQWGMRKVVDRPREEAIENYETVRNVLAGTKYASMLD